MLGLLLARALQVQPVPVSFEVVSGEGGLRIERRNDRFLIAIRIACAACGRKVDVDLVDGELQLPHGWFQFALADDAFHACPRDACRSSLDEWLELMKETPSAPIPLPIVRDEPRADDRTPSDSYRI